MQPPPIDPHAMVHWMAVQSVLTEDERRALLRDVTPSLMRWIVEKCEKYSVPEAVARIRQGRLW